MIKYCRVNFVIIIIIRTVLQQSLQSNLMETKATDIDRKLAIYYHPLFQEIIRIILDLFHNKAEKFEIGLLEFKALLPSFEIDNALISGLNDWVKEVAECLSYEGMVSTVGCAEVTSSNLAELIEKQYNTSHIEHYQSKHLFMQSLIKISNHDAFKLLGVKINKQVFSKFMFDLCSTWCQFLDVELFSYFLVGLYVQISQGETIENSSFKNTLHISTIDLQFMQEFEEIKSNYNRIRRKQLRYYRAWCEWNYLRVNEAGQRLILKLDQLHPDDNRILQLAVVFERAIQIINEEITSQNPLGRDQRNRKTQTKKEPKQQDNKNDEYLILKKLNIESTHKEELKQKKQVGLQYAKQSQNQQKSNLQQPYPIQHVPEIPQDFQIQIDEQGNMYLKRIVKLPILGVKIDPKPLHDKLIAYQIYLDTKNAEYRQVSNLYKKMDNMKVRLQHNYKHDPYTFKKNAKIQERDKFYEQAKPKQKSRNQMDKTIHQKMIPIDIQKKEKAPEIPNIKKQKKVSLRETKEYIHKVMAPAFLTDDANNLSFLQAKQGQIYANNANDEKRQLRIGLPKVRNLQFRVKQIKSYHIVGRLINDRSMINDKIRSVSIDISNQNQISKIDGLKEQNRFVIQRYMDEQQIKELNNYQEFYGKLQQARRKFGLQFQSQFRLNLRPILAYQNRRFQLGGIITKQDQERFSERMAKLINKQNRRNKKRLKKQKLRQYRNNFKNKQQKSLYEDIFINYHKDALKQLRNERKKHISIIQS